MRSLAKPLTQAQKRKIKKEYPRVKITYLMSDMGMNYKKIKDYADSQKLKVKPILDTWDYKTNFAKKLGFKNIPAAIDHHGTYNFNLKYKNYDKEITR